MIKIYKIQSLILLIFSFLICSEEETDNTAAAPNDFNSMFLLGVGSASGGEDENDDTPWSIGILADIGNDSVIGFDIAGEGTMLDSTYGGYDDLAQGTSYNFLYGADISQSKNDKIHIGLIFGFIETEADCPDSYIGYQCYADQDPDYEHEFNGGGFLTYSLNESINLGLRATKHSTMLTLGIKY